MVDNKNTIIKNISQWQCPTCGEMNDSNNSFCTNCGVKSVNLPLQAINPKNKNLKIAFFCVLAVFILITGIFCIVTEGFITNILITLTSCILPAAIGISFNFLGNYFKTFRGSTFIRRFLHTFGSAFQCICPSILMLALFYMPLPTQFSRLMIAIIALSVSFLGYIPAHYNHNYSLMKNNILGVIRLFTVIFMWSFTAGSIAVIDALRVAQNTVTSMVSSSELIMLLLVAGCILILLQTLKLIAEEFDDSYIVK